MKPIFKTAVGIILGTIVGEMLARAIDGIDFSELLAACATGTCESESFRRDAVNTQPSSCKREFSVCAPGDASASDCVNVQAPGNIQTPGNIQVSRDSEQAESEPDMADMTEKCELPKDAAGETSDVFWNSKVFCDGRLSRSMFYPVGLVFEPMYLRVPNHAWDDVLLKVFLDGRMQTAIKNGSAGKHFKFSECGDIQDAFGEILIHRADGALDPGDLESASIQGNPVSWVVSDRLYQLLIHAETWSGIADGLFEQLMSEFLALEGVLR